MALFYHLGEKWNADFLELGEIAVFLTRMLRMDE